MRSTKLDRCGFHRGSNCLHALARESTGYLMIRNQFMMPIPPQYYKETKSTEGHDHAIFCAAINGALRGAYERNSVFYENP
ncbi:unnamed protein product [Strongylus vulgaris]|uniref:Uncharacterized protein n=1 Tax=Strongylus vulgaris TaxID=40348 RepID=A0A3P7JRN3_STRVU|nr:unnamed protein product [Strongylus vulgaris]